MSQTKSPIQNALPPVTFDRLHETRLRDLAFSTSRTLSDISERLLEELDRGNFVAHEEMPENIINIGSDITFTSGSIRHPQNVILSFPEDADIAARRISVLTPIGVALIGLSAGSHMQWQNRAGETRLLTVHNVKPAN